MKNLLQKSLVQYSVFAFIVFALSIPSYFLLVDRIWLRELDENNALMARRIETEFNEQNISDEKLAESIQFWNEIQPGSKIETPGRPFSKDSTYTVRRENPYSETEITDRFRGLKTSIKINGQTYTLIVETNVEETGETVGYIAVLTLLFFLILVIGFWILNRRLSGKLWQPFRDTLQKLKSFQLSSPALPDFEDTDTIEFAELNATLSKLLHHSMTAYRSQKEFTENASHELQTPLAVLKNLLDILLQSDDLTQKQYGIAEEMNKALIRSSRINKNLLLLAKIDNSQFDSSMLILFDTVLLQSMEDLQTHFNEKNIRVVSDIAPHIEVKGNSSLTEVLIHNLLINAIRYTSPGGSVRVDLSKSGFTVANSGQTSLNPVLLFKRFSRLSSATGGSGLGLSIVREICRFQNWAIQYSFESGRHVFSIAFRVTPANPYHP